MAPWIAVRCSLTPATCSPMVPWPCTGPGAVNRSPGTTKGCFQLLSSVARERTGLPAAALLLVRGHRRWAPHRRAGRDRRHPRDQAPGGEDPAWPPRGRGHRDPPRPDHAGAQQRHQRRPGGQRGGGPGPGHRRCPGPRHAGHSGASRRGRQLDHLPRPASGVRRHHRDRRRTAPAVRRADRRRRARACGRGGRRGPGRAGAAPGPWSTVTRRPPGVVPAAARRVGRARAARHLHRAGGGRVPAARLAAVPARRPRNDQPRDDRNREERPREDRVPQPANGEAQALPAGGLRCARVAGASPSGPARAVPAAAVATTSPTTPCRRTAQMAWPGPARPVPKSPRPRLASCGGCRTARAASRMAPIGPAGPAPQSGQHGQYAGPGSVRSGPFTGPQPVATAPPPGYQPVGSGSRWPRPCRPRTTRGRNSAPRWPGTRQRCGWKRSWPASRGCRPTSRPGCCRARRCPSTSCCTTRSGTRCAVVSGIRSNEPVGKPKGRHGLCPTPSGYVSRRGCSVR